MQLTIKIAALAVLLCVLLPRASEAVQCTVETKACDVSKYKYPAFIMHYDSKNDYERECDAFPGKRLFSTSGTHVISRPMAWECCCRGMAECMCDRDVRAKFDVYRFEIKVSKWKGEDKDDAPNTSNGPPARKNFVNTPNGEFAAARAQGYTVKKDVLPFLRKLGDVKVIDAKAVVVTEKKDQKDQKQHDHKHEQDRKESQDHKDGSFKIYVSLDDVGFSKEEEENALAKSSGIILIGETIWKVGDFQNLATMSDLKRTAGSAYIYDCVANDQPVVFYIIPWKTNTHVLEEVLYMMFPGRRQSGDDGSHVYDTIVKTGVDFTQLKQLAATQTTADLKVCDMDKFRKAFGLGGLKFLYTYGTDSYRDTGLALNIADNELKNFLKRRTFFPRGSVRRHEGELCCCVKKNTKNDELLCFCGSDESKFPAVEAE